MNNLVTFLALLFDWIFFILADNKDNHKISQGFRILSDQKSAALERQEKLPKTYNERNVVTTLLHSFLDGSSLLLARNEGTFKSLNELGVFHANQTSMRLDPHLN